MHNIRQLLLILIFFGYSFFYTALIFADDIINIDNAWISEAPPTVTVLAAYARITNNSEHNITLININSPDFATIEIHRSFITDGMARMEKQSELIIEAGNTIEFKPGGYHLMLFNPGSPQKAGMETTLDFGFSNGETISIRATVERRDNMDHERHHH